MRTVTRLNDHLFKQVVFSSLLIEAERKMESIFFFRSEARPFPLAAHVTTNFGRHACRSSCNEPGVSLRTTGIANIESNVIIRLQGLTTAPQRFSHG
jgi:hypothetical protein